MMLRDKVKHQKKGEFMLHDITLMSHWRLRSTMTGLEVDAVLDAFLVDYL